MNFKHLSFDADNDFLEDKLARLSILVDHLRFAVLFENQNREITLVNQDFFDLFHVQAQGNSFDGLDCKGLIQEASQYFEEPELFIQVVEKRVKEQKGPVNEHLRLADGRVLEREYMPVFRGEKFTGHLWKYKDVTTTYRLQNQLRASEEKYRSIMENMELGLLEVDNNEMILRAYPAFCTLTGYQEWELIGKNPRDILLPMEFHELMNNQDKSRQQGVPGIYEVQLFRKSGERIWVLISGAPFFDDEGKVAGSVGIHYDITHIKKLQLDLIEAKQEAESARDAEKQFLANMSHEIRNPLHAIEGMNNLLYDTKPTPEQLQYLDGIKFGSEILQALISDVLDIAKIQEGKLEPNPTRFNLHNLLNALTKTAAFGLEKRPVVLETYFDAALDQYFKGDTSFLNQILLNLINNAVKFTEKGRIIVSAKELSRNKRASLVNITVDDSGIGIDEAQLPHIFERFRQADPQTKLKYGGTGLGLYITKELIELLGGSIEVKSKLGVGTTFSFSLELLHAEAPKHLEADPAKSEQPALGQVLIVEDNPLNRIYLEGLLKQWSINFQSAQHGREALDLLEVNQFDLVLMDIRMPVMDGYETTLRLRDWQDNPNQHIPVIALTASALLDERQKCLDVGMNEHVSKPFSPDQLKDAIARVMNLEKIAIVEAPVSFWPKVEGIDISRYSMFYAEDVSHAEMMLNLFVDLMPSEIEQLEDAVASDDKELTSIIIHRLKPSIGMVGLSELEQAADILEHSVADMSHELMTDAVTEFIVNLEHKTPAIKEMLRCLALPAAVPVVSEVASQTQIVPDWKPTALPGDTAPEWKTWDEQSRVWVAEGKPLFGPEGLVAWLWDNYQKVNA